MDRGRILSCLSLTDPNQREVALRGLAAAGPVLSTRMPAPRACLGRILSVFVPVIHSLQLGDPGSNKIMCGRFVGARLQAFLYHVCWA